MPTKREEGVDPLLLRELIDYDPETGELTWKHRDAKWFKSERDCKIWNTQFAGMPALNCVIEHGYKVGSIAVLAKGRFRSYRVAWALHHGAWPEGQIDHINGDPSDNRMANLRDVSHLDNQKNTRRQSNNTSGIVGVHWNKRESIWEAYITHQRRKLPLGRFPTIAAAAEARKAAEIKFGYHPNHGREPVNSAQK